MAGMLPGVECARRRRMWQGGGAGADQAAAGTRRLSFCLYAAGHGAAHAVGTGNSGNKVCKPRGRSIVSSCVILSRLSNPEFEMEWTFAAEERRHGARARVGAGQQCPGGQGEAGPEAQEQEQRARHRHQEASQHGEHQGQQSKQERRRRGLVGRGGDGRAAGGVLQEGRDEAADEVEPAAVGGRGAGGVRGVPGRVRRGRRNGAPAVRPPLPLGLRAALARGRRHALLPVLPRRGRRRRARRLLATPRRPGHRLDTRGASAPRRRTMP